MKNNKKRKQLCSYGNILANAHCTLIFHIREIFTATFMCHIVNVVCTRTLHLASKCLQRVRMLEKQSLSKEEDGPSYGDSGLRICCP